MKVIYGLGNPGPRYRMTRHNIGFLVVDSISRKWSIPLKDMEQDVVIGKGEIEKIAIMLTKPYTYMNLCGYPLSTLGVSNKDLIVVHDDMDIDFGTIRVKTSGGTGGHKGLDSIIDAIQSDHFIRIRCGIGRPPKGCDPSNYVLGQFSNQDIEVVGKEIEEAASATRMCLLEGASKAMNAFNRRSRDNLST